MKRKFLVIVLALAVVLLAVPFIGTVIGGKGTDKLHYEANFRMASYEIAFRYVPAPPPDANIVFVTLTNPVTSMFTLQIGEDIFTPNFDADMLLVRNLDQDFRLVKATETYTFDGVDGSLVISTVGRTNDYGTPDQMDIVNVVGHGTGWFEGVKISAKGYSPVGDTGLKIHEGTIMGWKGLPP